MSKEYEAKKKSLAKKSHSYMSVHKIREGYDPSSESEHRVIQEMASSLKKGAKFPPITLTKRGELLDGFHRVEAHRLAGVHKIRYKIKK